MCVVELRTRLDSLRWRKRSFEGTGNCPVLCALSVRPAHISGYLLSIFLMLCGFWGASSVVGWFLLLFILLVFFAYLYFLNLFHGCCFVLLCVLFFFVAIAIVFLNLVCVGLVICVLCTFCTDKQTKQQKQKEMNAHEHSRTKQ